LNAQYLLYVILLAGSLTFGLEALLMGLGGRLASVYKWRRERSLELAAIIGLLIVGSSIFISATLNLAPIYLCALIPALTAATGRIMCLLKVNPRRTLVQPEFCPEEDVKSALRKRGFDRLIKEKDKN